MAEQKQLPAMVAFGVDDVARINAVVEHAPHWIAKVVLEVLSRGRMVSVPARDAEQE